jgi:hypothetical protein
VSIAPPYGKPWVGAGTIWSRQWEAVGCGQPPITLKAECGNSGACTLQVAGSEFFLVTLAARRPVITIEGLAEPGGHYFRDSRYFTD